MSIIEIQGDLLAAPVDVICHGCNCFHTMNSGVARAIREKYPEAYNVDRAHTKKGDTAKLGTFTKTAFSSVTIYNLYAQWDYGRLQNKVYVEYDKLEKALEAMKQDLIVNNRYETSKIGMPRIGCGLAGGNWSVVKQIIKRVFQDKDIYIYSL